MTKTSVAYIDPTQKGGELVDGASTEEAIASSKSVTNLNRGGKNTVGLQQHYSPPALAHFIARVFGRQATVLDPCAGNGSLLEPYDVSDRCGIEIDLDQIRAAAKLGRQYESAKADIQHLFPLLMTLEAQWPVIVCNPPFGLQWEVPGFSKGSSTEVAFDICRKLLAARGAGAFVCGRDRFHREIIPKHKNRFWAIVEVESMFADTSLPCVVAFFSNDRRNPGESTLEIKTKDAGDLSDHRLSNLVLDRMGEVFGLYEIRTNYSEPGLKALLNAAHGEYERRLGTRLRTQAHTIELRGSRMSIRASAFTTVQLAKVVRAENRWSGCNLKWLNSFDRQPPTYFSLQQREWRRLLEIVEDGRCALTIEPKARTAIQTAIEDGVKASVPLYPVATTQRLGFLIDIDNILCTRSDQNKGFVAGQNYPIDCNSEVLITKGSREKNTKDGPIMVKTETEKKAMAIQIGDQKFSEGKADLGYILEHFEVPDPGDVASTSPEETAYWRQILGQIEEEIRVFVPGFRFRRFQPEDIARLCIKGSGVLAWEQGLGKSIGQYAYVRALEISGRLHDGCALFIMPQDLCLQMAIEAKKFFGRDLIFIDRMAGTMKKPAPTSGSTWTAFQVAEMVKLRRRDLHLQNQGHRLAPRAPIWAATWFEALAVTQHQDDLGVLVVDKVTKEERLQEIVTVRRRRVQISAPTPASSYWDHKLRRTVILKPTPAEWAWRGDSSEDFCPRCFSSVEEGWNGTVCSGENLAPRERRTRIMNSRAQGAVKMALESGYAQPVAPEGEDSAPKSKKKPKPSEHNFRIRGCGYVHRSRRTKSAYMPLSRVFDCVLVDEGTKIKGDSLQSKAVRAIQARYRLVSTGTPLKNYVPDLFWLLWWALGDSNARFPYAYIGGVDRFIEDFAVLEYRFDDKGYAREENKRPRMLPEVSNLLRLWKMLCSSLVRRRMDEVGAVISLEGNWKCPGCAHPHQTLVSGPKGWQKPDYLECTECKGVWDSIVPITYIPVDVPWGKAQRELYAKWLNVNNFVRYFLDTHPNSPIDPAYIHLVVAAIGQISKLEYATTDPTGDREDYYSKGIKGLSPWTPGRLKILQIAADAVAQGKRVLIGSSLIAPGPWIAEHLTKIGIRAGHICDESADGEFTTKAPKKRSKLVAAFRAGEIDVLCCGINAMNLGHNLDVASVVIVDGFPWDFATWDQFLKRARRLTSKRPVEIYGIIPSDSLATRKWSGLKDKTAASDLALDGKLSTKDEKPLDKAVILRELQERGAKFDGSEIPESVIFETWNNWTHERKPVEVKIADVDAMVPPERAPVGSRKPITSQMKLF